MRESIIIDVCLKENAAEGDLMGLVRDSIEYWRDTADYSLMTSHFGPDTVKVYEGANSDGDYGEGKRKYPSSRLDAPVVLVFVKEK